MTDWQTNLIVVISESTAFGVFSGAVAGAIVGATLRIMRGRTSRVNVVFAAVNTIVRSAIVGALAGMAAAVGDAAFFAPGVKWGYDVPDWVVSLEILAVVICATATAMRTTLRHA